MSNTVICKTKNNYKKLFEDEGILYPEIKDLKSIEENSFVLTIGQTLVIMNGLDWKIFRQKILLRKK